MCGPGRGSRRGGCLWVGGGAAALAGGTPGETGGPNQGRPHWGWEGALRVVSGTRGAGVLVCGGGGMIGKRGRLTCLQASPQRFPSDVPRRAGPSPPPLVPFVAGAQGRSHLSALDLQFSIPLDVPPLSLQTDRCPSLAPEAGAREPLRRYFFPRAPPARSASRISAPAPST